MRRFAQTIVLLAIAVSGAAVPPAQAGVDRPTGTRSSPTDDFIPMPCPDGVFAPKMNVDCGYVLVPQDRHRPRGRRIRVVAAVLHAKSEHAAPDPIVVLPGGPSAAAASNPFYAASYFTKAPYAADRDVVLVDPRGTGISTPRLGCPEVDAAGVRDFYAPPYVGSNALRLLGGALRQCRHRLVSHGVDPAAYTTDESVADLEALRRALGVHRWNVLAISADGVLGLSYLRAHPDSIRSVIVDSGFSTQMDWQLDYERGLAQELESIFAGCRANAACNARYPHIRRAFMRLGRRLESHPRVIGFPDFEPHPVWLRLDGTGMYLDALYAIFPGNRFAEEEIHLLLDQIWRETHGQLVRVYREAFGSGPVRNDHADRFTALGKSMSTICHDQAAFVTRRDLRQAARDLPLLADRYLSPSFDLGTGFEAPLSPAGCRIWHVGRAPRSQHRAVASDVPTLVLSGEYDTGVPPNIVRQVDRRLSRSTYVEFPASAHLQLASFNAGSDCARAIAGAFLRHPGTPPDTTCVGDLPPFDFTPPDSNGRPDRTSNALRRSRLVWAGAIDLRGGAATW